MSSIRTPEMIDDILERIATGQPLREICRMEGMPSFGTFYRWLNADPKLQERFARAREVGEEAIASECLEIADDASNDWMERNDKEGNSEGWQLNGDHVQRSKLRVWTRLQLLAKWNPKKWGEHLNQNVSGNLALNVVTGVTGESDSSDLV